MTNPATPTASLVERLRDEDLLMSATPHQLHDLVNEAATALETAEREKEEWRTSFFRELGCAVERTELITELRRALEDVVADILEYERVNNLCPKPGREYCWDSVARARAALASKDQ